MAGPAPLQDRLLDCTDEQARDAAIEQAAAVVRDGKVVVLPTDTVYGVGADAFDVVAVAMVLAAKHRGREMPPPVLVPDQRTIDGLATDVPMYAKILMRQFWPGPLTLVLRAQPSLQWDLGETNGTVALRMPDDDIALMLLAEVGPMAVTSANVTGAPAATTAEEALDQLGGAVAAYLDGGPRTGGDPSTILDCTGEEPVVLRLGALSAEDIRAVLGTTVLHDDPESYRASRQRPDPAVDANDAGQDAGDDAVGHAGHPTADHDGTDARSAADDPRDGASDATEPAPASEPGAATQPGDATGSDPGTEDAAPGHRYASADLIGSVTGSGVPVPPTAVRIIAAPSPGERGRTP